MAPLSFPPPQGPPVTDLAYNRPGEQLADKVAAQYRTSDDVLLYGPDGTSQISAADLALAVLDDVDHRTHQRRRFHIAH
ncbi:hypothetical protein [Propioniciclava tarda]|uniref:hypothetical protein n=1 Tax=Propioniciclava tarda TaxID=433330 RepID=UPI00116F257F|nr:hypothetical protein [Propioniciclava tarda]SMO41356.1 hypothetical protein SAMN06266982_102165 [Propioniciclava tarda]HQA31296.1 hypothetical protein [Propioniciclava tarda]